MSFFDQWPVEPDLEPDHDEPVWSRPDSVFPSTVPMGFVLGRSRAAVVAITSVNAFPNGFELNVAVLLRERAPGGSILGIHHGHGDPGELLRIGLKFADGSMIANTIPEAMPAPHAASDRVFYFNGGGGGDRRYDMSYWSWPLPPPGPLTLVCEWPAFGIGETSVEVDTGPILDAAANVVDPWQ